MKITLFTSNQPRHNFLISELSKISKSLYVIQENSTIFHGQVEGSYHKSKTMKMYFSKVKNAEKKIFKNNIQGLKLNNLKLLSIYPGDINYLTRKKFRSYFESDIYIVFGSSYIKNKYLLNFLVKKKTINIHMGISPYYRGTDCNFWAMYDDRPDCVGATIHRLTKGLDSGPILYYALSEYTNDPFVYTMSTVKSAILSLKKKIKDKSIFKISPIKQNKKLEVRYSKKRNFTDSIIKKFFLKKFKKRKKPLFFSNNDKDFILKKKRFH